MKNQIITAFSTILGLGALWLLFNNFPLTWHDFGNLDPTLIIIWLLVTFVLIGVHTLRWKIIIETGNHTVPFLRLYAYKLIGQSVSYFTPSAKLGGEPIRALLLKKHQIPMKEGLSSVVIDKVIELASSGIFFVIGAIILLITTVLPKDFQILLFVIAALIAWIIFSYYNNIFQGNHVILSIFRKLNLHNIRKLKKYEQKVKDFEDLIILFFKESKKTFFVSVALSAITWLLMFMEYKIAVELLGLQMNYLQIFLVFSTVGLAYIIPVPMSLGSLEAGQVGVFKMLGLKAQAGLALSLLVRARDFIWGIIGLILLSIFGFSIRKTFKEDTRIDEELTKIKV